MISTADLCVRGLSFTTNIWGGNVDSVADHLKTGTEAIFKWILCAFVISECFFWFDGMFFGRPDELF